MAVNPKRPKGPPLNALRAFEAAARHESFMLAARELGVTAGAITQHVKTLEAWVGNALFIRKSNEVHLTEIGRQLLPDFVTAFDALGRAVHALKSIRPTIDVHIATLPGIGQLWLSERLAVIRRKLPHIQLSVTAIEAPPNLDREMFDISLFITEAGSNMNQVETALAPDCIFPVCSRDMARGIREPKDLLSFPHLLDLSWQDDWRTWAGAFGIDLPDSRRVARYSLFSLALEEAKAGAGILMAHSCLVERALERGEIVKPLDLVYRTGRSLTLTYSVNAGRRRELESIATLLSDTVSIDWNSGEAQFQESP